MFLPDDTILGLYLNDNRDNVAGLQFYMHLDNAYGTAKRMKIWGPRGKYLIYVGYSWLLMFLNHIGIILNSLLQHLNVFQKFDFQNAAPARLFSNQTLTTDTQAVFHVSNIYTWKMYPGPGCLQVDFKNKTVTVYGNIADMFYAVQPSVQENASDTIKTGILRVSLLDRQLRLHSCCLLHIGTWRDVTWPIISKTSNINMTSIELLRKFGSLDHKNNRRTINPLGDY